jgi:hypothetical protein
MTGTFDFPRGWADVQAFFSRLNRMPADKAKFLSRYGSFENEPSVDQFVAALEELQQVGKELGGPDSARRRISDGQYLLQPTPPEEVYASMMWVSMRAGDTANTIASTLELLPTILEGAGVTSKERAQRVRQLLAGSDGLVTQATETAKAVQSVAEKVDSYAARLNKPLLAVHDSEIVNQANGALSDLKIGIIPRLQKQFDEASEKAKGWFGADKAKEELDRLTKEIANKKLEIERKTLLESDMGDFFASSTRVAPALASSADQLRRLGKRFQDFAERTADTCRLATGEQLSDATWLAKALNLHAEITSWRELQSAAQQFTQEAMASQG